MNVLIAGATGFIGRPLCKALTGAGHEVTALVRNPSAATGKLPVKVRALPWDPSAGDDSPASREAFSGADAVINLAGESLAGRRWNADYKQRLRDSRIETTRQIVAALRASGQAGRIFISGSAVGYYGDCGDETVTEQTPPGHDFLATLCRDWEAEALEADKHGLRVVLLRTGIVLGRGDGALEQMLLPYRISKLFAGGPLGSGRQWLPWIHLEDTVRMIVWALGNRDVRGPLNVTAPNPVTMRDFAATLGRVLHRPAFPPVPGFALKLALGEFANALLGGQRALPEAAQREGYIWRYEKLEPALGEILKT